MKNKRLQEIILALLTVGFVVFVVNPWHWFMPLAVWWSCVVAAIIAFGIFATFIWREEAVDEREAYHKMFTGRIGFLAGAGAVMVGILYQSIAHQTVDLWLLISLAVMLLAKIIAAAYSEETW